MLVWLFGRTLSWLFNTSWLVIAQSAVTIVDANVCNTIERRIRSFLILVHSNDFTAFHTSFWIYRVTMRERERVIAVLKRSNFIGKRIAGKRWWGNKKWERTAMHGRGSGDLLGVGVRASIKKMPNGFPIRIQIARNGGATGVKNGNVLRSFRGKGWWKWYLSTLLSVFFFQRDLNSFSVQEIERNKRLSIFKKINSISSAD